MKSSRGIAHGIAYVAVALSLIGSAALPAETITLRPGFQRILDHTEVRRISIGNPEILEASALPGKGGILLVGKREGSTDLVLWERGVRIELTVDVRESNEPLLEEAKRFAAAFSNLSVSSAGRSVILRGIAAGPSEKAIIERFAAQRPGILSQVTTPDEEKALLSYDLKILEIGKGATEQFGIRWPESFGVRGTWTGGTGADRALALSGDFDAALNLLLANGQARILANPKLVCETGRSATFLAGGEIPIVIVTPETRTVEWKTYGIILKITPVMEPGNRVRTDITAEISTVDHGSGGSDIPGFLTRRVSTHFTTLPGGTVMLSGLVKSETAKDVSKVPLLGQIPILGELFKSRRFRENQTELAIFITPTRAEGAERSLADWESRDRTVRESMRYRLID
ncbi:MAG: pilus assembly protein N-terminal domain-containing protein [Deltaproteobacteria bacterium]